MNSRLTSALRYALRSAVFLIYSFLSLLRQINYRIFCITVYADMRIYSYSLRPFNCRRNKYASTQNNIIYKRRKTLDIILPERNKTVAFVFRLCYDIIEKI